MDQVDKSLSAWCFALTKEAALESTFNRAVDVARGGAILRLDDIDSATGNVVALVGDVRGSYGNTYKTEVQIDLADQEVIDYRCTCPAAMRYPGMCKHEIGIVLAYLSSRHIWPPLDGHGDEYGDEGDERDEFRSFGLKLGAAAKSSSKAASKPSSKASSKAASKSSSMLSFSKASSSTVVPFNTPAPRATSSIVVTLMDEARRRLAYERSRSLATSQLLSVPLLEPVVLEATIKDDGYGPLLLSLRVRRGKVSYAIRDILDLLRAWRAGEGMTFGSRLRVPSLDVLDERSHHLLEAVNRIDREEDRMAWTPSHHWSPYSRSFGAKRSEFSLDESALFRVLDAMMGSEIKVKVQDGYLERYLDLTLEVRDGEPDLTVKLVAVDGGYEVKASRARVLPTPLGSAYCITTKRACRCDGDVADALLIYGPLFEENGDIFISADSAPAFCRSLVPGLRRIATVSIPRELEPNAAEPRFVFAVGDDDGDVVVDARVLYGEVSFKLFDDAPWANFLDATDAADADNATDATDADDASQAGDGAGAAASLARDEVAEAAVVDLLWSLFPDGAHRPKIDAGNDGALYNLLTDGLARLHAAGEVMLSERLRRMEARPAPRITMRAKVRSGLLDIALGASGMTSSELAVYLAGCRRSQRFVRLSDEEIVRIDDGAREALTIAEGLGVSPDELAEGVKGLAPSRAVVLEALLDRTRALSVRRAQSYKGMVDAFDSLVDADLSVPAALNATLRSYQEDGMSWMGALEALGCGGILADDMGLGKTLQAIAHVLARHEAGDTGLTLVVCPASLVYNWMAELNRFAPTLRARAVLGDKGARRRAIADVREVDVLVTSYDLMRRDIELYQDLKLRRAILDEAHYIKNPGAQVSMAAKCLPAQSRFALTGTPMENRVGELWSIFDFIMPGFLGTRSVFNQRLGDAVAAGDAESTRHLRRMTSPFILRRLKSDVLADLPEKTESVVSVKLEGEQRRAYLAHEERIAMQVAHELPDEFSRKKLQVLAEITRLRQLCCDPRLVLEGYGGTSAKLEACVELVTGAVDGGHQVLVFSQFTSMLDILFKRLGTALRGLGCTCEQLTGSCSKKERANLVERFQAGETRVLLISLKAGGVGLNLTAADVVIHYDPWWNVAAQQQATDRAHRIGQKRCVSVFKLIAAGTIEERIMAMQQAKSNLAESILSGASTSCVVTREDFLAVLGASAALTRE